MAEHTTALIVLIVANLPLYILIARMMFDGWEDFGEAIVYLFTPNFISWFRGEGLDDIFATFKFHIFLLLCGASVYGEFQLLHKYWLQ